MVRAITRAQSKTRERERVDNIAADARDGAVSKQVKLAPSTSSPPAGQGKGITPKQSLSLVVAGQLEGSIPDLTQNTSPRIEEGAEVVGVDVLTSKSDETDEAETDEAETYEAETYEAETDEADVEEGNSLVGKVKADNIIGLEREDVEASDQPLPTSAKGKEAHVLASQQKEDNSLTEMRIMGDEQVDDFMV